MYKQKEMIIVMRFRVILIVITSSCSISLLRIHTLINKAIFILFWPSLLDDTCGFYLSLFCLLKLALGRYCEGSGNVAMLTTVVYISYHPDIRNSFIPTECD